MTRLAWNQNAERPGMSLWIFDSSGALIDFSSGYTYSLKLGQRGGAALLTKSTGITGAVGAGVEPTGTPNVVITWSAGELDLSPGVYRAQLTCTTSSADRVYEFDVVITAALT